MLWRQLLSLLLLAVQWAGPARLAVAPLSPSCARYEQVHSGCATAPGPPTYCGKATKLYDGATVLANGTVINGKRFHWETSLIAQLPITAGDPVVSCARACGAEPACAGFALEPSSAATTCFTVNSTSYTLTRLAHTPSYGYTHDPTCRRTCGSGSDALRLPAGQGLYQPRPSVAAMSGGAEECAALCDRLPGCVGFSVSNTIDALCFPTNSTSRSVATFTPVLSYARTGQHPRGTAARHNHSGAADSCAATLRHLCPLSLAPISCRVCTGRSQRDERTAGCRAEDVAQYCAAGLDWWVTPPTDHIFEDDTPTMSQYCGTEPSSSGSSPEQARQSVEWSVVAGGTAAAQLAMRWPSTQAGNEARVTIHAGDLVLSGHRAAAIVPASSLSVRQVGSVFAQTTEYSNERGPYYYPDILAPIYQPSDGRNAVKDSVFEYLYDGSFNGTNGRRLAWESGGRQLSNQRVPGGGGAAGVEQCQQICLGQPACRGFFLGAAGDCHTVNATNVAVATGLAGVSYRRKRIGLPLVPNLTRAVWIDVTVPATTAPGLYTGSVAVLQLATEGRGKAHAQGQEESTDTQGQQQLLFSVPISLRVWRIHPDCLATQLGLYGKAYGFDPMTVGQLYPPPPPTPVRVTADGNLTRHGRVAPLSRSTGPALPKAIQTFTDFMCERHVPAEALANSWATQRPLSDIELLLDNSGLDRCQQPLFNAAFLGITNPPQSPPPENITETYVKKSLDAIAPRMEQLKAAGLLSRGYIYAFDESKEGYSDALRLLFGEVKQRWPEVSTLSVLNWTPTPDMPLDIWVTLYPNLDEPAFQSARVAFQNAGKQVWGYHCVAPSQPQFLNTFLDVPSAKSRLLPLVGALHNLTGWLFWYTNWGSRHAPSATDSATGRLVPLPELSVEGRSLYDPLVGPVDPQGRPLPDHSTNEDGNWVYAGLPDGPDGGEGPLASQRLELWRLGMEDLALLKLLGPAEARELAQKLVRSGVDYTFNATLLEETRAEAVARLLAHRPHCALPNS